MKNANRPHFYGKLLPGKFEPFPKNPTLAKIFVQIARAEELGTGIRKVYKYIEAYSGGKGLEFLDGDQFTVRVPLNERVATQVTPQATPQVTPQVEAIVLALEGDSTRDELQSLLKIKDREYFRKSYLKPALEAGLIEMTIPDKPNSKNQRYRLTQVGLKLKHKKLPS